MAISVQIIVRRYISNVALVIEKTLFFSNILASVNYVKFERSTCVGFGEYG